jgi:hypothetical protein
LSWTDAQGREVGSTKMSEKGGSPSQATNAEGSKLLIIKHTIMKDFLEIMEKDIMSENFSKRDYWVYGVIVPCTFVVICVLANVVENL